MAEFLSCPPREQQPLPSAPYDRWVLPGDVVKAEFHRIEGGYLMRFPREADFAIYPDAPRVVGWPAPDTAPDHFASLFHNAILPLIGDHNGGLFLHGSAVSIAGRAAAFLGQSGDGKTTLAGWLAKAGHPFLTEDVIELVQDESAFWLQPKPSGLRLFPDSAQFLLGAGADDAHQGAWIKSDIANPGMLPFCDQPAPLAALFLLGSDHSASLVVTRLEPAEAVQKLLPHSFILDVEDKRRLRDHFCRIVGLSDQIPCYSLDYYRDYHELPAVAEKIVDHLDKGGL
jgi:hypothetical protein